MEAARDLEDACDADRAVLAGDRDWVAARDAGLRADFRPAVRDPVARDAGSRADLRPPEEDAWERALEALEAAGRDCNRAPARACDGRRAAALRLCADFAADCARGFAAALALAGCF